MVVKDILRYRLFNHQLTGTEFSQPVELVAWYGAVQAQDYPGAKWALGMRLPGVDDAALEQAFNEGAILRTHVMRPTWHFVAPADIRWLLALTAPRVRAISAFYYRQQGLDSALFKRSQAILTKALRGGQTLTRTELSAALQQNGVTRQHLGLGLIMMRAELDGLICSGPRRGKQFTYALLDERVPPAKALRRDEALAELAGRYFTSHGPAILQDFVWWSGLTAADAKIGIEDAAPRLEHETIDGKSHWFAASTPPAAPRTIPRGAFLLPNYDEYTIAYKARDAFYNPLAGASLELRGNAPFAHMIVMGGRIIGTWNRILKKDSVRVETRYIEEPSESEQRAVARAAERYGKFLKLPVTIS